MSKRRKWAIGCGAVAGLMVLASVVVMFVWADFPIAAMQFGAAEERARKAGVPLTLEELRQHFPSEPEQNSAPVYHRIFEEHLGEFGYVREAMLEALAPGGRGPEEALRAAARVSGPMSELYRASKLRYYVHELDLDQLGFEVGMIQFGINSSFRGYAVLFATRGEANARVGRSEEAARDLGTARRMAGHVGQDPFLISALVATGLHSITTAHMQRSAEALARDPEGLEVLEREVRSWPELPLDLRKTMLGEAYYQISMMRNIPAHSLMAMQPTSPDLADPLPATVPRPDGIPIMRSGKPRGWILQGIMARTLEGWATFFEAVPETGATPADFELATQRMLRANEDRRWSFLIARLFQETLILPQNFASTIRPMFEHRATLTYLDVLQFRNQHRRWPESLAEAGVEALDPYDGQPLRYRVEGEGFRIWSVGPDKRDDSGITQREAQDSETFDLVAIYPNPEIRTTPRAGVPAEQRTPGAAPTPEEAPASP